jgi:tRNA/tmRNA/rRNA uracil-C5-methylase (TrmA/RlmC/RlmD family)
MSHREREGEAPAVSLLEGATPVNRGEARAPVIEIVDIAFPNNYGVGKIDGYVLFVPGAIPQDKIRVNVVDRGKRFGYGKIVSIEEPSPFRVEPFCPHFGLCGGCTLQHLAYNHQLIIKENYLRQTLKRLGNIDLSEIDVLPITPSPETLSTAAKSNLPSESRMDRSQWGFGKGSLLLSPMMPLSCRFVSAGHSVRL